MSQDRKGSCSVLQMQCHLFLNAPCADLEGRLGEGHLSRSVIMPHTQPRHKTELQLFQREAATPRCNLGWWSPWWYFCSNKWLPAWPYESFSRTPQRPLSAVGLFNFYIKMNKIHISTACSHSSFPLGLWHGKEWAGMLLAPWRYRSHRIRDCIPAATQQRGRCSHSLLQPYYLPEIYCLHWSHELSFYLGKQGLQTKLSVCICMGEQTCHTHLPHLIWCQAGPAASLHTWSGRDDASHNTVLLVSALLQNLFCFSLMAVRFPHFPLKAGFGVFFLCTCI